MRIRRCRYRLASTLSRRKLLTFLVAAFGIHLALARLGIAAPLAYVANADSGTVAVIDTVTNVVMSTLTLPTNSFPQGVAVEPDGRFIYVAASGSQIDGVVIVIDTAKAIAGAPNALVASIQVGKGPQSIAVGHDGALAYVTNSVSDTLSVIDTATNTVAATVRVGVRPFGIALTPDDAFGYLTIQGSESVQIVNAANDKVIPTSIPIGAEPEGVAISADGLFAYTASAGAVSVITVKHRAVTATIPVPGGFSARAVALSADGKVAYVTVSSDGPDLAGSVEVIDTTRRILKTLIPVGSDPEGIALTADGARAYVTNQRSNSVSVIDTGTNAVVTTIPVGLNPVAVAVAPAGSGCTGDCDGNGRVTINELLTMVNIALGNADVGTCLPGDANHDGTIDVSEILAAIDNALTGCPAA